MMDRKRASPRPPGKRKEASVTAFRKFYRINSWAVYRVALLDPDGIDADHPADLDDRGLGVAAREALVASRFIGPDHPDWDRVGAFSKVLYDRLLLERLKARAGVKTHGALYTGVGYVHLTLKDGRIVIDPRRYEGRGGFGPIRGVEPAELPEAVADENLGAAIRHQIEISRKSWKS